MADAAVLFDLDGVLADSRLPITSCMNAALDANGLGERSIDELVPLVGPPMAQAFAQLSGHDVDSTLVAACVAAYRERYADVSVRETRTFAGVPEALAELGATFALAVATSKPLAFAEPLITALGLREHFTVLAGPDLSIASESKAQTMARALTELGGPSRAVMVGDRCYDVVGAHANALPVIGVTWGIGSREELARAGATVTIDRPGELPGAVTRLLAG